MLFSAMRAAIKSHGGKQQWLWTIMHFKVVVKLKMCSPKIFNMLYEPALCTGIAQSGPGSIYYSRVPRWQSWLFLFCVCAHSKSLFVGQTYGLTPELGCVCPQTQTVQLCPGPPLSAHKI